MQWSTVDQPASVDDDFTLLQVMMMMLLDTVLYMVLAWYVEAVWPGEFGIPQPWYFPVLVSRQSFALFKDASIPTFVGFPFF